MNTDGKRRILQWAQEGDHTHLPVMMSGGISTAASCYGVPLERVTPTMVADCMRELDMWFHANLGHPTPFDAIPFMSDFEERVTYESAGRTKRRLRSVRTPAGDLTEVFKLADETPAMWLENFVTTEEDLAALACLVERAAERILSSAEVQEHIEKGFGEVADAYPAGWPTAVSIGVPAFEFLSNLLTPAEGGLLLLADFTETVEHIFDVWTTMIPTWVHCAAKAGADFVIHAINGLELYSPSIYERYFIPQAQLLHDLVHDNGMHAWVHTCGRMDRLIDMGVYEAMRVDVLESLSHPPLGDVGDLAAARRKLGEKIITRGGVNVELFYASDVDALRARVHEVASATRGFPHMIGDTNDSYPPYPRANIIALVDEVKHINNRRSR